jgi:hypothetical protein
MTGALDHTQKFVLKTTINALGFAYVGASPFLISSLGMHLLLNCEGRMITVDFEGKPFAGGLFCVPWRLIPDTGSAGHEPLKIGEYGKNGYLEIAPIVPSTCNSETSLIC